MTNELKPCPWCGRPPETWSKGTVVCWNSACALKGFGIPVALWNTRPSPAPTVSVEEALTRAVRKADEEFERVGGSSRHWVRDCFLPAIEAEGLCVSRARVLSSSENHALIAECVEIIDNELAEGNSWDAAGKVIQRCLKALASHPASVAGEDR